MAYSPIMPNMKLSAQDMGVPDYMAALQQGMQGSQMASETVQKPRQLSEALLNSILQNKMNTPKAEGAQLAFDTDIGYKQALTNAANRPSQMTGETAQLFALRNSMNNPDDRKIVDDILARKAAGSSGTTVFDPASGQPLVQIGGGSGKSSGGGAFMNPVTGEMISQPTPASATNLQGRVVGAEAVKPYLEKIVEDLPQFRDPVTQATTYAQKLANAFLGADYRLPSQEASGKAAIKEASEGMLKSFGLNATGANRQAMEDILKPRFGESKDGYAERVRDQAAAYAGNQQLAKESLGGGIKLGSANPEKQAMAKNKTGVPKGKMRVYFPDGPHIIPESMWKEAEKSGATLKQEIRQ